VKAAGGRNARCAAANNHGFDVPTFHY
jgi:hypothetical protein